MNPSRNGRIPEVNHLTDWSNFDWTLRLAFEALLPFIICAIIAAIAAVVAIAAEANIQYVTPAAFIVGGIGAFVAVVWGYIWYGNNFLNILRHTSSVKWSLATALVLAAIPISAALAARIFLDNTGDTKPLNIATGVICSAFALTAIASWIIDALYRGAAWIPTDIETFVNGLIALILIAVGFGVVKATER